MKKTLLPYRQLQATKAVLIGLMMLSALPPGVSAAQQNDAIWPCIQPKVKELSIAQVWNGPTLPESAPDWRNDTKVESLVEELAARRNPLDVAEKKIVAFSRGLAKSDANQKLSLLFQGLFDTLNSERLQVIAGISRYANKQREMADEVRNLSSSVDAMKAKPDTPPDDLERATEKLIWETRIYQERVHSLTTVCEVPTIIEQRLYALSKAISARMLKR